jgi:hypothetical protein
MADANGGLSLASGAGGGARPPHVETLTTPDVTKTPGPEMFFTSIRGQNYHLFVMDGTDSELNGRDRRLARKSKFLSIFRKSPQIVLGAYSAFWDNFRRDFGAVLWILSNCG